MQEFSDLVERVMALAPSETKAYPNCVAHGGEQDSPDCHWCRIQREAKADAERDAAERREAALKARFDSLGMQAIPERFRGIRFDTYAASNLKQMSVLQKCRDYAARFPDRAKAGESMMLLGAKGTGKTHLAAAIASEVVVSHGMPVLYTLASKMFRRVKETYGRRDGETESEVIACFAAPSLLVVDEVGVGHCSATDLDIMFEVVNERYERRRPTIIISNIADIQELEKWLGERALDRLREGGAALLFDWESKRNSL